MARCEGSAPSFVSHLHSYVYKRHTTCYMSPMATLNAPLSVRLSEEDSGFLARLELDGSITASDKIRGLIRQARQRAGDISSFPEALAFSHEQLAGAVRALRLLEQETDAHSDVVMGLIGTAEEFLALALTTPKAVTGDEARKALLRYEAKLVDCALRMSEQLLRWAITPRAPAYDPTVIATRAAVLTELLRLISPATAGR